MTTEGNTGGSEPLPPAGNAVRVGIVDEYPAQVEGLARMFRDVAGMEVVMLAHSGDEALSKMPTTRPDVVVIEPWMRSHDGITCIATIAQDYPDVTIVALSRMWDEDHVAESMSAGISTHLPKTTPLEDIPALVRQSLAGVQVRPNAAPATPTKTPLTSRERDVLRLAAQGMSNEQIAAELVVSPQTIKFHLSNTYRKLRVQNRTEAAHAAARMGMLG